jgi:hypothetical protein
MAKFPIKVKRFISRGELDGTEKDTDAILESCANLLDRCESHEILGQVVFEGEDGKFYTATVEADIGEADPDYVKQVMEEAQEGGE